MDDKALLSRFMSLSQLLRISSLRDFKVRQKKGV